MPSLRNRTYASMFASGACTHLVAWKDACSKGRAGRCDIGHTLYTLNRVDSQPDVQHLTCGAGLPGRSRGGGDKPGKWIPCEQMYKSHAQSRLWTAGACCHCAAPT